MRAQVFKSAVLATALCFSVIFSAASHANLLTNGDFETSNATGWSIVDPSNFTGVTVAIGTAQSGQHFMLMGAGACCGTISQTVTTISGLSYSLSYWFMSDGATPNYFDVLWNGSQIPGSVQADVPAFNWKQFAFSVLGTGSDTLTFREQNSNGFQGLDNVSLTAPISASVPEPASLALLGLGLSGIAALRRRKN